MTVLPTQSMSLWAATASAPAVSCDMLPGDHATDILVIGGGFTGLSTALHLAEGGASVTLVEAEEIGHGASGRNGGQANPGLKHGEQELVRRFGSGGQKLFRMGEEAVDFLHALIDRKKLRCHFMRPGLIRLAHLPSMLPTLEEAHRALNARGIAARLLPAGDVDDIVGTRRYCGGLFDPRGANLHPLDLARELARVAMEAGARIFVRSRALSIQATGGQWRVVFSSGTVTAKTVVVATNAYSDALVPGLARSILPVNSFQIATEPLSRKLSKTILPGRQAVYDSRRLVLYFRKSSDDRILLGGRASFSSSRDDHRSNADYAVLAQILHDIFPQLKGVGIAHHWTGLVAITPDFLPHYHTPQPRLHVALGFNGRGVAMANRTGAWLAHRILGQVEKVEIPATDIKRIPIHGWRAPILNVAMQWHRLMDTIGR